MGAAEKAQRQGDADAGRRQLRKPVCVCVCVQCRGQGDMGMILLDIAMRMAQNSTPEYKLKGMITKSHIGYV